MKYEKCLSCKQLGNGCDGPNLLKMDTTELRQWLNELRKKQPGMTYDHISSETGISKTAIYNFFTGASVDCRLETLRAISGLVIGTDGDDNPCGNVTNSEKAAYEDKIRQLEEGIAWRDDKIAHIQAEIDMMLKQLDENKNLMRERYDFLKRKDRAIFILSALLAVALLVMIAGLVIDRFNPDVGFFWLDGLLKPYLGRINT